MNVIFFMADQHNAKCTGYMGHPVVKTPTLDALAAKGVYFTNMFSCTAICGPSRTSFFTGTYLRTHAHFYNRGNTRREFPSILTELKNKGYTTVQVGKDHLPQKVSKDFDEMYTRNTYTRYLEGKGLAEKTMTKKLHKEFMSFQAELPEQELFEAWTASRAIDFLRSDKSKNSPFFMWCSFRWPHARHCPPESFDNLYNPDDIPIDWDEYYRFELSRLQNRPMIEDFWKIGAVRHDLSIFQKAVARYLSLVTFIDREINSVLKVLEENGLAEDTIIIYTADHGDFAGNYGQLGKNLPAYDHLIQIPFIYYDPTREDFAGRVIEGMHESVDLFPTLMERLGLAVPPTVQGKSFLRSFEGYPGSQKEYVFSETPMVKTIRSNHWKLNFFVRHPGKGQFFKMGRKPDEITNLWDDPAYNHIKQQLMQQLMAWMVRCEQPDGMSEMSEEYIDTPWYKWLASQPDQVEIPSAKLHNEK